MVANNQGHYYLFMSNNRYQSYFLQHGRFVFFCISLYIEILLHWKLAPRRCWYSFTDLGRIGLYKKYHNTLCLSTQNFAWTLFPVSFGIILSPKRKYKQFLCKILSGQKKSIMIFFVLTNWKLSLLRRKRRSKNVQISAEPGSTWGPCGLKAEILPTAPTAPSYTTPYLLDE